MIFSIVLALFLTLASAYDRTYFYVGGGYTDDRNGEHIFTSQMYVEKLTPAEGASKPNPIVFIHGSGQTGTVSHVTRCELGRADLVELVKQTRWRPRMGIIFPQPRL